MRSRIALFTVLVLALPVLGTDTERKVKVALALAEPAPKVASKPAVKGLDWFGEACPCCKDPSKPCSCSKGKECGKDGCPGGCSKAEASKPAKAKEYTTVYVQECSVDPYGRKTCQWVARQVEKK